MYTQGAFVIVLNESQQILLVKRKDVPLWDLPGGRVDPGESAVREVLEETGYNAALSAKIGVYQRPKFQDEQHVFFGSITGGQAVADGTETARLKWVSPERLPLFMVPNRKRQINDFKNGAQDVNVTVKDRGLLAAIDLLKRRLGK
ncbi:NUDIX hydrolase [Bacillus subtilis]|uniref:NUDIX hydrolase n=1 Tax=Bacillus subtilis TaxID=1423 RepID=UPI00403FBF07